jgi:hypothetical protein
MLPSTTSMCPHIETGRAFDRQRLKLLAELVPLQFLQSGIRNHGRTALIAI